MQGFNARRAGNRGKPGFGKRNTDELRDENGARRGQNEWHILCYWVRRQTSRKPKMAASRVFPRHNRKSVGAKFPRVSGPPILGSITQKNLSPVKTMPHRERETGESRAADRASGHLRHAKSKGDSYPESCRSQIYSCAKF